MDKPIVACIQHRLTVAQSAADYNAHLNRFLRMAKAKGAVLALFPELSGLGFAIPTFSGWRSSLLKTAKGQPTGVWKRTKAKLAGSAANITRADLQQTLFETLQVMPESLHDAYVSGFSALARQYEMTIVAGSLYEVDAQSNTIQNVALVFGPDGQLLGRQAKAVLSERDRMVSQPTEGWGVIPTPAGRVGILLGNDVLYPEPARILAYQGADMFLATSAVSRPATYHKIRQAALARCQENQLYGMVSFLVGPDPFAEADAPQYVGKSAIFAPLDFTARFSGVMVEVGSPLAEGVITAEWDYPALHELWQQSDTPLRREMPLLQAGPILATVYGSALSLADAEQLMLDAPAMLLEDGESADTAMSSDLDYDSQSSKSQPLPKMHTLLPDATIAQFDDDDVDYSEAVVLEPFDEQIAPSQAVVEDATEFDMALETVETPESEIVDEDESEVESNISQPEASEVGGDSEDIAVTPTVPPPPPEPDTDPSEAPEDETIASEDVVEAMDADTATVSELSDKGNSWWQRFWSGE